MLIKDACQKGKYQTCCLNHITDVYKLIEHINLDNV